MDENAIGERRGVHALLALLFLGAALASTAFLWDFIDPPAPRGTDTPAESFSAVRAREVLERLAGDESPHPLGSQAAADVRERIQRELRAIGIEPVLHEGNASAGGTTVAPLVNVLARVEGTDPARTILCVAHYDSVAAGPGIGDDLAGCAALVELARMARMWPRPRPSVAFLFLDGEEEGMLGAAAFAAEHPWMSTVEVVLNLEGRGTRGPSYLFETGVGDGWLIDLYAKHARRPATSSLAQPVYRLLPQDTDFTVFRARDCSGANFAYIEGAERYHTPLDGLAALDVASLQHHGENAQALLQGLWALDLGEERASERVWFDVASRRVVSLAPKTVLVLASIALLVALLGAVGALASRELDLGGVLGALAGPPAIVAGAAGLALAVRVAITAITGASRPWLADSLAGWLVLGGAVLFALALLARAVASGTRGSYGVWITWSAAAFVLALFAPGASFLALVPAVLLVVLGPLGALQRRGGGARAALALALVLLASLPVWVGVIRGVVAAFGLARIEATAAVIATLATLYAPILASSPTPVRRALGLAGWLGMLVGGSLTILRPAHELARPAPLNLEYALDLARGTAHWIARPAGIPLPAALADAGLGRARVELDAPWRGLGSRAHVSGPVAVVPYVGPSFQILEREERGDLVFLRGHVRSTAGAAKTYLALAPRALASTSAAEERASIGAPSPSGRAAEREEARARGPGVAEPLRWLQAAGGRVAAQRGRWISFVGLGSQGAEVEIVLTRGAPTELWVLDRHGGLPPEGAALLRARADAGCVPIGVGDGTLVLARVPLEE